MSKLQRIVLIGTTVLAIALLYFFADARYSSFFPRCPFHLLTGLFCPGCGSQRALSALLHIEVTQAIRYNALMVFCLPLLVYAACVSIANAVFNKQLSQPIFYSSWFTKMLLTVVIMFWVARNIPLYPFLFLAPNGGE